MNITYPAGSTGHARLLKAVTTASVSTAVFLALMKLGVWWFSGSLSVLASFMDSLLDMAASLISLFAVRIALKPADEDHHFGHGKAEQLAALAQASFIAGSALYLIFYAAGSLREGSVPERTGMAVYAMIFSVIITLALVTFQSYVVARTKSPAIRADAAHYKADILVNIGVLVALLLSHHGWKTADPLMSIVIALIMLLSVKKIGWDAIQMLMDRALPEEELEALRKIVHNHPQVLGMHELRTRYSGNRPVIQFHLDMDGALSLQQAHEAGSDIKRDMLELMPEADIIFHIDPQRPGQYTQMHAVCPPAKVATADHKTTKED